MDTAMLIGSRFEAGTENEEHVLNPKTGETVLDLPEASLTQVDKAVDAAEAAFRTWSQTTPAQRSAYLLRIADAIERDAEGFAALEALNCGKPINAVLNDEIPAIVDCYRFFAGAVRNLHGPVAGEYLPGHTSMIRRDPVGIVGSIAPWNYPLMMMAWKLAPALAGGNTVVFKPSEQTPLSALKMAKLFAEILPEGVVNVILGRGETVGSALINHPKIGMVSITGDPAPARRFWKQPPRRSSGPISNSAARRQSSSSTMPISTRWCRAFGPSATTTPARTALRPAASTPTPKYTTGSSPT